MTNPTELELKQQELQLRREQLDLERAKLFVEFAKFGFGGTLTAAVLGMVVVMGLGLLSAFTAFKVEGWILLAIAVIILLGAVAFGYLSLWEFPRIAARFRNIELAVSGHRQGADAEPGGKRA